MPLNMAFEDGYQTLITLGSGAIKLYERSATPPGVDGGDPIDNTTMINSVWRTKSPRSLKEATDGAGTYAYEMDSYTDIIAQVNVNQLITVTFPDGGTLLVWGYLKSAIPNEHQEGEQPTLAAVFVVTNRNASGVETAPAVTTVTTTTAAP